MNVRCPECLTMYRVDPAKVTRRLRARCSHCSGVMTVEAPNRSHHALDDAHRTRTDPTAVDTNDAIEAVTETVSPPSADHVDEAVPEPTHAAAGSGSSPTPVFHIEDAAAGTPRVSPADSRPAPVYDVDDAGPAAEASPLTRVPTAGDETGDDEGGESPPAPPPTTQTPVSRPFVQPRAAKTGGQPPSTKRPAAPVFRPTPGMPVQTAPVPPPARPTTRGPEPQMEPSRALADQRKPVASTLATAPQPALPINPFLSRDPRERARRLARALVSDIIVYQPEKRRLALQEGTLPEVFREEIGKSWKEYRQQMGEEFASSTPYFTEALNEILAEGRQIF